MEALLDTLDESELIYPLSCEYFTDEDVRLLGKGGTFSNAMQVRHELNRILTVKHRGDWDFDRRLAVCWWNKGGREDF